jgi:hypothetical protein
MKTEWGATGLSIAILREVGLALLEKRVLTVGGLFRPVVEPATRGAADRRSTTDS